MRFLLTVLVLVAGLAVTSTGRAQDFVFDGAPIVGIEIVGNQRIEAETIRSYMQIGANDRFEPAAIDRAFKTIDFLALLDIGDLEPHTYRSFFER